MISSPIRVRFVAILLLFAGLLFSSQPVHAQSGVSGQESQRAITTAVPFLLICPDSRSGGMAEAGVAVAEGANALYWNPSRLTFSEKRYGAAINYTPWLKYIIPDINHAYLPAYYNFGEKGGVVGGSLTFFSLGNIQFTDENGIETGNYNASEMALSGSYSIRITETFSTGISLRYINSNLAGNTNLGGGISTQPANSFAGDIHGAWQKDFDFQANKSAPEIPMRFAWGFNVSNIGAKMRYTDVGRRDFLPMNLKLGYALTAELDSYNKLTFTNDFNKLLVPSYIPGPTDPEKNIISGAVSSFGDARGGFGEELSEINVSLALEYVYNDLLAVRGGYFYEDPGKGNRKFITLGAGLKFKVATLDFAYLAPLQQNHPLQNTLRFSLSFDFE
ncbi:MAG: type IX secretion system outer membrane channel protein PorV [Bacteroidetes bacterium]|nr:type IX secretion system outer membrane channel protein PorV [Bacteroidota bacterium]